MRRTERLFQIIQILRSTRSPITGRDLADELEISIRTLYRDMAELMAQRIPITGEAGMGYVLDDGYDMPPLMLTADELEAAALGAAWVAAEADPTLSRAARDLVSKLSEAIPRELRPVVLDASTKAIQTRSRVVERFDGALLRHAIRERYKLELTYIDRDKGTTNRIVWPLLIAFLDRSRYLVAWCETREDFRHFKTDRVQELKVLGGKYPGRRTVLIRDWERAMAGRKQG
ncbi:putative DNA-binding transcriptional regulator YafY [Labrenzia sp. EL_208]|uniref:helix-turn-helix transcriptional regulator n=1 Tax=Roseibium album TaxID=311410 RepID=UPI000CF1BCB3|nr:putative DNA-binding transcriptional regulator YafY [Labrenzia sp. EL_142]MBG6165537.1 putative DNA-binding transcriptional regulator YafY [Labrenzia sp. EL_195]MBG6177601.1 putative DNA-binding transcriptional regulator YafY [Labrenzia sp. EL_132]MBG6204098.1 putative DNA-binding transcriptional regulator YafY [Labrenzia sp. EL_13]MBG6232319.1 putative DNA-binding transcriptional regulator YafY [Labrenzia sp. EL_208]